jgi:hypothetical protein
MLKTATPVTVACRDFVALAHDREKKPVARTVFEERMRFATQSLRRPEIQPCLGLASGIAGDGSNHPGTGFSSR